MRIFSDFRCLDVAESLLCVLGNHFTILAFFFLNANVLDVVIIAQFCSEDCKVNIKCNLGCLSILVLCRKAQKSIFINYIPF